SLRSSVSLPSRFLTPLVAAEPLRPRASLRPLPGTAEPCFPARLVRGIVRDREVKPQRFTPRLQLEPSRLAGTIDPPSAVTIRRPACGPFTVGGHWYRRRVPQAAILTSTENRSVTEPSPSQERQCLR